MIIAHLIVQGVTRETREVPAEWLHAAAAQHETVIVRGESFFIIDVEHFDLGVQSHAYVQLARKTSVG